MEGIALTGAWVDKDQGLLSLIALELGVSSRLVAYLRKGEPVVRDGTDRRADGRFPSSRMCCCSAADSATRCCSRSPKACARPATRVIYFAGYKKRRRPVQARGHRGGDRSGDLEHRHGRGDRARPSAGRPLPRQHRAGDAGVPARRPGRTRRAAGQVDRIIAIGSDRMMAAVQAARHGVLAAASEAGPCRHRQHQLADAVHDERGVRAMPAEARRSGHRAARRSSSRASTRISKWIAWTSSISRRGCGRTPCRRSSRISGSITCWMARHLTHG